MQFKIIHRRTKLIWLLLPVVVLYSCNTGVKPQLFNLSGKTQGTSFHITLIAGTSGDYQAGIDSILKYIDTTFSTYIERSQVSRFNAADSGLQVNAEFIEVLRLSQRIHRLTGGAFDPTVGPLVRAYGFGPDHSHHPPDSLGKLRLLSMVGMEKIKIEDKQVIKQDHGNTLDFNAIAQGYTVDAIAAYLDRRQVTAYMVEVGGELKVKGMKPDGTAWIIGIDRPEADLDNRELYLKIRLKDKAMATSGNYRKFYVKDGHKVTHTIDPRSGETIDRFLLSATILHDTCAVADALATAFMVMGKDESISFLDRHKKVKAILIYSDENGVLQTYVSPGLDLDEVND